MGIGTKIRNLFFVRFRIWKYNLLSDCGNVVGKPKLFHPMLLKGKGKISFGNKVQVGVIASPMYYSHYAYLEARKKESVISIGNNVTLNNAFSAEAFSSITIKDNVLFGINCSLIDNDGHDLSVDKRNEEPKAASILIENNVFIGDNVVILKGVTIGENSVIGNGSVVTSTIPENVIAAGNPAKVIRNL